MVGKMSLDLLNLETLKFLMHLENRGVHFIFYIIHTHILFLFSFFLSLYSLFYLFLSFFLFFICSP
jgi:hypothetical protein